MDMRSSASRLGRPARTSRARRLVRRYFLFVLGIIIGTRAAPSVRVDAVGMLVCVHGSMTTRALLLVLGGGEPEVDMCRARRASVRPRHFPVLRKDNLRIARLGPLGVVGGFITTQLTRKFLGEILVAVAR